MTGTTQRIAHRFLAIGGRFLITPSGQPDFGINMGWLISLDTPERERRRRLRITRAARRLVDQRGATIVRMVRRSGAKSGLWTVWEGR